MSNIPVVTTFRVDASQAVTGANKAADAIEEFGQSVIDATREASAGFDRTGDAVDAAMREVVTGTQAASTAMEATTIVYRTDSAAIVAALDSMGAAALATARDQQVASDDTIVYLARIADETQALRRDLAQTAVTAERAGDRTVVAARDMSGGFADLGIEAASLGRKVLGTGVAILGFASIVEGSRKVIEMTRRAIAEYIAENDTLTPVVDSATGATDAFREAMLGQLLTTENLTVIVGAYQGVVEALSTAVQMNEGSTRALADAVATGMVNAVLAGTHVVQFFGNVITGASLAADTFRLYLVGTISAVVDLALAVRTGLTAALAGFIDILATGARVAGDVLARIIGEDSVNALRNMQTGLEGSAEATRNQVVELQALRDAASDASGRGLAEIADSMRETIDGATTFNDRINTLQDTLVGVRQEIAAGSIELSTYSAAATTASASVAELTEQLDKLKESRLIEFAEAQRITGLLAEARQNELDKAKADADARYLIEQGLSQRLAELDAQRRADAERTAVARIDAAAQTVGAVLAGQETLADAARREAGEALKAVAQQFAALAVANGLALNFPKAAGYAAGAVALYAGASALGASGGSAGGNVPASAPPTVTNVTNRSTTVNVDGVVTDSTVRQIAEAVTQAEDGGLLRRSA